MPYYNPYLQFSQTPQNGYLNQGNGYLNQPAQNNNGLIWVQGETGAKSYMVAPNSTVMLMDSESQRFYLKSTDASGMPQPLRIFEYAEKPQNAPVMASKSQTIDYSSFATKAELEAFKAEIEVLLKKGVDSNGKPAVSRAEQANPEG